MELEDQVCSLELANKLKKLGVKETHKFYWVEHSSMPGTFILLLSGCGFSEYQLKREHCAAFTVAELLDGMHDGIRLEKLSDGSYGCEWPEKHFQAYNLYQPDQKWSAANACAKMKIYLLENKLITVESVNGRVE